jgi:hypothetical protein
MTEPATGATNRGREALGAFVVALVAVSARLRPMRNPDIFWQIRTGDVVLATHRRVATDLFSLALRGRPIHDHEPAFEALVAWIDRNGGMKLLWWTNVVVVVAACVTATIVARKLVESTAARVLAMSIVVAAIAPRLELRAEAFTFFALAIAHGLRRAEKIEDVGWRRFAPIALAAIASPFHGLALFVCAVPIAHALEAIVLRRRSPDAMRSASLDGVVAIATFGAAELVAPGMIANVFGNARATAFNAHIVEYYSPLKILARARDWAPLASIVVAFVAAAGLVHLARASKARLADAFLIGVLVVPGFVWARFSAVAAIATLPWTVAGIAAFVALGAQRLRSSLAMGLAIVGAAVSALVCTANLGDDLHIIGFDLERQPVEAVEWLKVHRPDAKLFHPYNYGAYLIYAEWPPEGVVIDPRSPTVYPNEYAERYYAAASDPNAFQSWANEAPFDTVLLQKGHHTSAPLRDWLATSPEWRTAYEDRLSIVFVRR